MDKLFKPWTALSPAPPKLQSCSLFWRVETGGQNKSNPTAWHVTHTLFNFDNLGKGVSVQYFPRGLNILSIYGRSTGQVFPYYIHQTKNHGIITHKKNRFAKTHLLFGGVPLLVNQSKNTNKNLVGAHFVQALPWMSPTKICGLYWLGTFIAKPVV